MILEAPQGARLQFDKNFRPERSEIGAIQHGEFPGKITIRSDMQRPGAKDDQVATTRDVQLTDSRIWTDAEDWTTDDEFIARTELSEVG